MCVKVIGRMFHVCFKEVLRKLQECFKGVEKDVLKYLQRVSRLLRESGTSEYQSFVLKSKGCPKIIFRMFKVSF